jgi:hypothetical protein
LLPPLLVPALPPLLPPLVGIPPDPPALWLSPLPVLAPVPLGVPSLPSAPVSVDWAELQAPHSRRSGERMKEATRERDRTGMERR